jgi:hypothetical protein
LLGGKESRGRGSAENVARREARGTQGQRELVYTCTRWPANALKLPVAAAVRVFGGASERVT